MMYRRVDGFSGNLLAFQFFVNHKNNPYEFCHGVEDRCSISGKGKCLASCPHIQPCNHCVPWTLCSEVKLKGRKNISNPKVVPRSRILGALPPAFLYAFIS
jgi:hypothetical protein